MPWFKIDDSLWGHPKWLTASPSARALWVTAGSWCMAQVQDGKIPAIVLPMLGGKPKDAAELVAVGLWELQDDGGWLFHDWHDYQPTREQIESDRHAARERQRRARERSKSQRESRRDRPVTHDDGTALVTVPPSRPDPTVVPEGTTTTTAPRRGARLPDDFAVDDLMRAWARENVPSLDVEAATVEFVDYWRAVPGSRGTKLDWTATWRNRMREVAGRQASRPQRRDEAVPHYWQGVV